MDRPRRTARDVDRLVRFGAYPITSTDPSSRAQRIGGFGEPGQGKSPSPAPRARRLRPRDEGTVFRASGCASATAGGSFRRSCDRL